MDRPRGFDFHARWRRAVRTAFRATHVDCVADLPKKRATYEDVVNAPDHMVAEIIDGDLLLFPRPAKPHAVAASALGEELGPPFKRGRGGPGGWIILNEPEFHFGGGHPRPGSRGLAARTDARHYHRSTLFLPLTRLALRSAFAKRRGSRSLTYAPDLRTREVGHVWLVDPLLRTIEVLRRQDRAWLVVATFQGDAKIRAEPFDAIELELGILWVTCSCEAS
jgi:hypothetical protein